MLTEKQFEEFLLHRRFEPASSNLAERIIARAGEREEYQPKAVLTFLQDVFNSVLPRPAYALAFILIIGILIGTILPAQAGMEDFVVTADEEETL